MDAAQRKTIMTPGQDSAVHEQALQSNIATALGVPQEEVVPEAAKSPLKPETAQALGLDLENIQEDFNALAPWAPTTPRVAPAKAFLQNLLKKVKRQNPQKEVVEEKK